jgi:uncharacterized PurR-regulated membrane protein YhhQ (DUF165 family)
VTRYTGPAALAAYAASITAANYLTNQYGLVPVGLGLVTTAGTFAAGAALLLRDTVQDTLGKGWARVGIIFGALATLAFSPTLAIASAVAFLVAESADMAVYNRLRANGWARAALVSGVVGAIVDTAVFLRIAPFPFEWAAVWGQLAGKAFWATLLPVAAVIAVRRWRRGPVSRHPVRA